MTDTTSTKLAPRICPAAAGFTHLHPGCCVWHCYFLDLRNPALIMGEAG